MSQKIAVLILHGAGTPKENFADKLIARITKEFNNMLPEQKADKEIVFEPVFWSSVFAAEQVKLWEQLKTYRKLRYSRLRRFVLEFLADAVAYQPTKMENQNYDKVHALLAKSMQRLREKAGEKAPLCVISHSLGTIIASNYFYDLQYKQENIGKETKYCTSQNAIEQCQTLTLFYTLGSPMAMWSLRYIDFGSPIAVPSPLVQLYYPNLQGEWLNFYDKDDILAFPLKGINEAYNQAVTEDVQVNVGGIFTSWNPLSHLKYDTEKEVIKPIVNGLVRTWKKVNRKTV
ncbi:chemotaxis protein [Ornithinibacillus sp. BX22]|uniref:Chemotaxis protein n=2 Tax=Ornithinibacillus TaxID=484508 RepID=A0A923L744_9BACI|nr:MULTISPECIES: chemotaxis protein [Ornithinibacillus]MBC5637725.1 chemotaxis protein [Ornithinibacillus hominis]MBS3681601.1 chemotaxis protein [Ornithinibacillus massiliensis]